MMPTSGAVQKFMPAPIAVMETPDWAKPWGPWAFEDTKAAARIATARTRGSALGHEAYGVAWEGVALHVAENPQSSWLDAVNAGTRNLGDELSGHMHGKRTDGASTGSRFFKYWTLPAETPMERVEENLALAQVLGQISEKHREVLYSRCSFASDTDMAISLGESQSGVSRKVREARAAFARAWFDWEQAPQPRVQKPHSTATHCRHGHPWSENLQYVNTKKGRQRRCRTCNQQAVEKSRRK